MKKTFVAMFLAVVMALTMVGGAFAEDAAAIKIGLIGPMTGAAASYGVSVAQGAELAVGEVNALGGVHRRLEGLITGLASLSGLVGVSLRFNDRSTRRWRR